jgi:BNR repeat-containing family member
VNSFSILTAIAALAAASASAASVTLEAESGALGADWAVSNSASPAYITITSNDTGNNPASAARVATYSVTFPVAGTYQLYSRVRVGPNTFNDDSLFYANGFGTKSPTTSSDWILVNNLGSAGFDVSTDVVTGGGTLGSGVWKWINLSQFTGQTGFTVSAGNLTQTFQIGAREDGLDLDKFVFGTAGYTFTVAELDAGGPGTPPASPVLRLPPDIVAGNLIQFNDNGNWTWYSDERSIVDKAGGKIVVGSDGNGAGMGGSARNGAIEAAVFDLLSGTSKRYTMLAGGILGADDHNAPAFLLRPDGKYLAQWTGHNQNYLSYFSVFDGITWGSYTTFDWQALGATSSEMASYSNPHYLSVEGRTYTFVRSLDIKSMNILVSTNYGDTWTYYGKLNRSYPGSGYNPGYYKFCDNGKDRIDFICTESHPRDTLTSIYHGYISNGMSFKTDGTVVDSNLNDTNAPLSSDFQLVFSNGTVMPPGMTNYRCWDDDVQRYDDGTIECIISARINQFAHIGGYPDQENPDHAFFFCRWDGTKWTPTYLCQAGYKLYSAEADYVGLGALSPNDPNTIFISTRYDPRAVQPGVTDTSPPYSAFHEIWKGVTTNHGASFTWTPITQNSTHDNLRPIVPVWDDNDIALIWFRGTYDTAQIIDGTPVGLVERHAEMDGQKSYVDANTTNTILATGAGLVTGAGTDQWHLRTDTGNNGDVLASADVVAEDAPMLKTTVSVPGPGTYDLWVNFWGSPLAGADWRIMAGTDTNQMQTYREQGSEVVHASDYTSAIVLTNEVTNFLYQAYVGRVTASSSNTVSVFVDDNAIAVGATGTLAGDTNRTWYDGVSYAAVTPFQLSITNVTYNANTKSVTLSWNSIPPQSSLLPQRFTVQRKNSLSDTGWTTVATNILSAGSTTLFSDAAATNGSAFYRITLP